jgi:hypothetical protein
MSKDYDEAEIRGIKEALEWARPNADFDFKSILPDIRYSNDEIYRYLMKALDRMNTRY